MKLPSDLSAKTANVDDLTKLIYSPFKDQGLRLIEGPDWIWQKVQPANVRAYAVSDWPKQQAVLEKELEPLNSFKPQHAVMYNVSPVHIDEGSIDEGIAVREKFLWAFRKKGRLKHIFRHHLADFIRVEQESYKTEPIELQLTDTGSLGDFEATKPLRLSAPGINNYYHAVWECLPLLIPALEEGFSGKIYLRSATNRLPGFLEGFIDAIFPSLKSQIELDEIRPKTDGPKAGHYSDFLSLLEWNFYADLWPGEKVDVGFPSEIDPDDAYELRNPITYFWGITNSYSRLQKAFRDRAVEIARDQESSHLPKRFWISRKGSVRRPEIKGEEALVQDLIGLGFEEIQLETLSVLEQVNLFQNAEIAIGQHGAGMTNMMFSSADTTVIEIGHGQTIQRWRTFHQMAAVSGCQFECFFCDYDTEDPTAKPNMARDGFPVPQVTEHARAAIIRRVKELI